jgi:hypothetical protein
MADQDEGFRPISNPYIVGNPIKDRKLFFGREDDFAYLQKKITGDKQGGVVVLCGARRSGKTSILFQIFGGRLGDRFVPILIDMQSITVQNDAEFLAEIAKKCIAAVAAPELSLDEYLAESRANPHAAFANLSTRLDRALAGRKLVMLFDEYELFENCIDKKTLSVEVFNLLSNWMEHKEGVFIVFTGSDKLEARSPSYWEKFLGKAIHRRISFLSESDTLRLIREPVTGVVAYDEGVPDEIYRLSAGQPFYTQVLCQNLVDHLNDRRSNRATLVDVEGVVDEIVSNPLPQMIFSWTSIKPIGRIALSIMAELTRKKTGPVRADDIMAFADAERIGFRIDANLLKETLEKLVHDDLITRDEASGGFLFKMGLWQRWLAREHSVWQAVDEIKASPEGAGEGLELRKRFPVARAAVLAGLGLAAVLAAWYFIGGPGGKPPQSEGTLRAVDSTDVTIHTEPPGAQVFLGAELLGRSPIDHRRVPVGRSVLRAELGGFHEQRDSVELRIDIPLEKNIVLLRQTGSLAVRSDPPGAEIIVDGQPTGRRTPFVIRELAVNRAHSVSLRLKGYADYNNPAVEIVEDSTITLAYSFSQLTTPLTITTTPGGEVLMDGRSAGNSPFTVPSVPYGSHRIEVRREGYETYVTTIDVSAENNVVQGNLVKLAPGKIEFRIEPWADIYVDGELKSQGKPYFLMPADAGKHEIRLLHPSYPEVKETVTVNPNETCVYSKKFTG